MTDNNNISNTKEILRKAKEDVIIEFHTLKKSGKLDKEHIVSLLDNCNTIEEIIVYYLELLKKKQDKDYIPELLKYYTIITPKECAKHGITKISEKQRFINLIEKIIGNKTNNINKYINEEFLNVDKDVYHLYEEETKNLSKEEKEKMKSYFIRWDNIFNTGIDFDDIDNEEYFYYTLSNSLLRDYIKSQMGVHLRKNGIEEFYKKFEIVEKDRKYYKKYFSYICLGLLNVSITDNNIIFVRNILSSINTEISDEQKKKILDINEIQKLLKKKNAEILIKENKINILYEGKNFIIDNYNNYNLTKANLIASLEEANDYSFKLYLDKKRTFEYYTNQNTYFDGLLVKIILNYIKSNLSKTSIEYSFNIDKDSYTELFNEVTTDRILDYIVFLPYNTKFDTQRTLKLYKKIIIDPTKELFNVSFEQRLYSEKLKNSLKKFVNITKRKYEFEHEQQHMVTLLLFYLYINEKRRLNSFPREINFGDPKIKILEYEKYEKIENEAKKQKKKIPNNIIKEAGIAFEILCYGKEQKKFSIKQLLFIANEKNDELDFNSYRNKYEKCSETKLEKILDDFPNDQPLSNLVKEIKEGLEEERQYIKEYKNIYMPYDEIIDEYVAKKYDNDDYLSCLNDFENIQMDIEHIPYDNHLHDKTGYY